MSKCWHWWVWGVLTLLSVAGVVVAVCSLDDGKGSAYAFYETKLQGQFFQALLVVGGLLLALQTFIVGTMKESVYDTEAYAKDFQKQIQAGSKMKPYDPLRHLNELLFTAICVSLASAVIHYTVGLVPALWSASVALATTALSLSLLVACLLTIHENLRRMFRYLSK